MNVSAGIKQKTVKRSTLKIRGSLSAPPLGGDKVLSPPSKRMPRAFALIFMRRFSAQIGRFATDLHVQAHTHKDAFSSPQEQSRAWDCSCSIIVVVTIRLCCFLLNLIHELRHFIFSWQIYQSDCREIYVYLYGVMPT